MTNKLTFELISPISLMVSETVDMVVVPGADGDFGVLSGHIPVLSTLRPGIVDIHNEGAISKSLFIEGGFAEVTHERCTVLATSARDVEDISEKEVDTRLASAVEHFSAVEGDNNAAAPRELAVANAMAYALKSGSQGVSG